MAWTRPWVRFPLAPRSGPGGCTTVREMPSDLGLRSTIGLGLIGPCTAVAPSVAPTFAGMIPNPRGSVVVHPVIAVEDGGSPLSDGVRATAEALDVTGGGGGPGVAHEASDVLQGLVAVHEQCRDDGAATGVGAELGSDTGGLAGLLDDLGARLPQHEPAGRVGGREVIRSPPWIMVSHR